MALADHSAVAPFSGLEENDVSDSQAGLRPKIIAV
jgi:hypothetical protein